MKRPLLALVIVALIVIAAEAVYYATRGASTPPTPSQAAPQQQAAKTPPAAPLSTAPSFDAVNVGRDGSAVIAGRAAPGSQVTVLDNGAPVGHATADSNGEWVVTTDKPLASGARSLSVIAQKPGEAPEHSASNLAVVVPDHGTAQPPVAVVLPQGEGAAQALGGAAIAQHTIALDMVEYDANGHTMIAGRADPGATVTLSVNAKPLSTTKADTNGAWSFDLASGVPSGRFHLDLAAIDAGGDAAGHVALDLARASPEELQSGSYLAVVPGNSLWHLAQRTFGDGLRYVELYRANQGKVADPDKIYPGQLLAVPGKS